MPTIIRCGGGIPVSDYESLQAEYNSYKSSHVHTNDEYNSYGTSQYSSGQSSGYNSGYSAGASAMTKGTVVFITVPQDNNGGTSYHSSVATNGSKILGGIAWGVSSSHITIQGSNDNSNWATIGDIGTGGSDTVDISKYAYVRFLGHKAGASQQWAVIGMNCNSGRRI